MNSVVATKQGSKLIIKVSGRFTFSLYKEFGDSYKNCEPQPETVDIDLRNVEYIDSAALGMLMIIRDYFGPEKKITLLNANDSVRKILDIARFDKKFLLG